MCKIPHPFIDDNELITQGFFNHWTLEGTINAFLNPEDIWSSDFPTFVHEGVHFYQTIGTANGFRLLSLRNVSLGIISDAVEHCAKTCSGVLTIPLSHWLMRTDKDIRSDMLMGEIVRSDLTFTYLYGDVPNPEKIPCTPSKHSRFGYYWVHNYNPVPHIETNVTLAMLVSQYPSASYQIHQPLGARLLREGIAKMLEIYVKGAAKVRNHPDPEKLTPKQVNNILWDNWNNILEKEACKEDMSDYYAAYNLFRALVPTEYHPDYHFIVLAELALMGDYVVNNYETIIKHMHARTDGPLWTNDVSPGVVFVNLLRELKASRPPIKPIDIKSPGDVTRFADELAAATKIPLLSDAVGSMEQYVNKDPYLLGLGEDHPLVSDVRECLAFRKKCREPLFVALRSPNIFNFISQITPPSTYANFAARPNTYDWASPSVARDIFYRNTISCPIARSGRKLLCHVLKNDGACTNAVPCDVQYGDESKYHDDCLYFDTLRFLRQQGVVTIRTEST